MGLSPNIIIHLKQTTMKIIELLHNILYVFIGFVTISNIKLEDINNNDDDNDKIKNNNNDFELKVKCSLSSRYHVHQE